MVLKCFTSFFCILLVIPIKNEYLYLCINTFFFYVTTIRWGSEWRIALGCILSHLKGVETLYATPPVTLLPPFSISLRIACVPAVSVYFPGFLGISIHCQTATDSDKVLPILGFPFDRFSGYMRVAT